MKRKGTTLIEFIVVMMIVIIMTILVTPVVIHAYNPKHQELEYHIIITRPDGVVHREFNIITKSKVEKNITHGGVTRLEPNYGQYDWENETIAPVGWNIEYTLQAEKEKR